MEKNMETTWDNIGLYYVLRRDSGKENGNYDSI